MAPDKQRSLNAIRISETIVDELATLKLKVKKIFWDDGLPVHELPTHVLHIAGMGWALDVPIGDDQVVEFPSELARNAIRGKLLDELKTLSLGNPPKR